MFGAVHYELESSYPVIAILPNTSQKFSAGIKESIAKGTLRTSYLDQKGNFGGIEVSKDDMRRFQSTNRINVLLNGPTVISFSVQVLGMFAIERDNVRGFIGRVSVCHVNGSRK